MNDERLSFPRIQMVFNFYEIETLGVLIDNFYFSIDHSTLYLNLAGHSSVLNTLMLNSRIILPLQY